jgi:hypothetical protein
MTEKEKFYRDLREYLAAFTTGIGIGVVVFLAITAAALLV